MSQSAPNTIRAGRSRAVKVEVMYLPGNCTSTMYSYLKILVPYLDNPSEEAISESM